MKIYLIVYGCKVNQAEAQRWELMLKSNGYEITNRQDDADLWLINTCAVTHKAEVQSRQIIKKAKDQGIKAIVTGCYVTLYENVDYGKNIKVFPNKRKNEIINEFVAKNESKSLSISRHRAIVKIQDGCSNFCSYCVVPYLRGNPISINRDEVLSEIKQYEQIGIKEIVLSGINLGLYGKDSGSSLNFLLKEILDKTEIPRIRLSSIEINHIDEEFLEVIEDKRICKHLHIPLQSGSDRILKLMNRQYDTITFEKKFNKIINKFPKISIGTDVIIGFPSEKEQDFEHTFKFIENLKFSYLHVFSYSSRPMTTATKLKEQIPESLKRQRAEKLIELGKRLKESYIQQFIDQELEIIVESKKNGFNTGTSDNYIKCIVEGKDIQPGELVRIKVERVENLLAFGSVVNHTKS